MKHLSNVKRVMTERHSDRAASKKISDAPYARGQRGKLNNKIFDSTPFLPRVCGKEKGNTADFKELFRVVKQRHLCAVNVRQMIHVMLQQLRQIIAWIWKLTLMILFSFNKQRSNLVRSICAKRAHQIAILTDTERVIWNTMLSASSWPAEK